MLYRELMFGENQLTFNMITTCELQYKKLSGSTVIYMRASFMMN
jgi:hypothetical protein